MRDFDVGPYVNAKDVRRMDKFVQFAIACSDMALRDSGLDFERTGHHRVGVSIGTGIGGLRVIEEQTQKLQERGPRGVSPFVVPMMLGSIANGHVAIRHQLRGPNLHVSTACATGSQAIGEAACAIQRGDADVMLAGAAESPITPLFVAGFGAARALTTRNAEPSAASRPFDSQRDGFVMGEGAALLVLESEEHARRRGADIWGELAGYGVSNDAFHVTAPHASGLGAQQAMRMALGRAAMTPEDIGYINAHGTATILGDAAETQAVQAVFGNHALDGGLWLSATKSMIGHLLGASGAVEAVVSLMSLRHGQVHPTLNLAAPDADCRLDCVPGAARERQLAAVMSNSFGFGGTNASLIFKRYERPSPRGVF
jgi:3-oxoacyl-[acyl-carrier-protein] synthase II